ncbi:lysine-specific demethylase 6A [Daphnia magna]|nr:lysine-specific demethylase 6A [Daphnia magna]XP_032793477.2 lysine-specific demethylase 6A [Daphnia magna]
MKMTQLQQEKDTVDINLTPQELQILSELDSRQYGFLQLNSPEHATKKMLVVKAIQYLERMLSQAHQQLKNESENLDKGINIDPKTYCKLGHFNILIEDYPKAMSAYQKFRSLRTDHWRDTNYLYGLGLVYFHFNSFNWAIKAFQQLLYIDPVYCRANEVHLRLGLIFKVTGELESSLKHFQLTLIDSAPCSLSQHEIRFHIAHLYEVSNRIKTAKEQYEQLLLEKQLPPLVRADIYRQLGWMHHCVESLGERNQRELQAIQYLQQAIEADHKSGQSLYLLGRCYASIGKVHEAFLAYRNSVDKTEGNADTWCSIGVLYQQQNQPMDALQAYICAVQLDKNHSAAWTNLGILYETSNQPRDGLACYVNAARGSASKNHGKPVHPNLLQRTKFLQQQLEGAPTPTSFNKPRLLPSIEDAWNLPITAEMNSRQQQMQQRGAAGQGVFPRGPGFVEGPSQTKRFKVEGSVEGPGPRPPLPPFYLTSQQLQMLQYLQQNQNSLTPQQQQLLLQLQNHYRLMQQHQQQLRLQQQQQQQMIRTGQPFSPRPQGPFPIGSLPQQQQQNFTRAAVPQTSSVQLPQQQQQQPYMSCPPALSSPSGVSDQELQALLSQKDIAATLAEDLLKQFAQEGELDLEQPQPVVAPTTSLPTSQPTTNLVHNPPSNIRIAKEPTPVLAIGGPMGRSSTPRNRGALKGRGYSKIMEDASDTEEEKSQLSSSDSSTSQLKEANIKMSAREVLDSCRGAVGFQGLRRFHILSVTLPPPQPPEPPVSAVRLSREQLLPPTPSVYLESKKDAFSIQLQEFCLKHPIAVVRGMASALKMDLGLFSTKTLVEANADHPVEVRTQLQQPPDENWDPTLSRRGWACISHRSITTIAKYAQYQASSFQESLKEEHEKMTSGQHPVGGHRLDSDSDSKDSVGTSNRGLGLKKGRGKHGYKTIKFGTNVDLSDERKWRPQLQELMKLPAFARVVSASNMLTHVGHVILGMNTVQLYMKVPGSRTPGHQENNSFCSININIGPGDCEWFGVPDAYWGAIHTLCEKNNINFLHGSWWPMMEDLLEANIPVYKFLQRPGDVVWVNSGCIHWVQAIGWCNNIAWNVGPLTARQYQLAIDRYEWNKLQSFKSIVPMIHLSWNLARNIKVSDPKLFELLRNTLMKTLRHTQLITQFVRSKGVQVRFHGRGKNEASHYCGQCEEEVFNMLFIKEQEKKHVVHCLHCSRRHSPNLEGFVCLEEYHLEDLIETYDSFVMHPLNAQIQQPPTPVPTTSGTSLLSC